jgi:hypothetical protein
VNAREFYDTAIRQLPALDRLRLASLILDDLAASAGAGIDLRDSWNQEDISDLAAFSLKHAGGSILADDRDA